MRLPISWISSMADWFQVPAVSTATGRRCERQTERHTLQPCFVAALLSPNSITRSSRKPGPTRFSTRSYGSATFCVENWSQSRRQVRDSSNQSATRFVGRCGFSTKQTNGIWRRPDSSTRRTNGPVLSERERNRTKPIELI